MRRSICWVGLGVAAACLIGCNAGKGNPPAQVKGTVILDAQPMADGEITFLLPGEAPSNMTVKNGAFSGTAPPGKNKVEVRAFKTGPPLTTDPTNTPTKVNYIPDRFNASTTLEADVKADGPNEFKFEVSSQ